VRLWDVDSGTQTNLLDGATEAVHALAFAPDGRTLASAGDDGLVRIWDLRSGQKTRVYKGHVAAVSIVAFAPDGHTLASAGRDGILLWDPKIPPRIDDTEHQDRLVWGAAFAPDGRALASAGRDGTVRLWDVATGRQSALLEIRDRPVTDVAFAPNGRSLASAGSGTVRLWDLDSQTKTTTLAIQRRPHASPAHHVLMLARDAYERVGFAPDGNTLATVSGDGSVRLWNLSSGTLASEMKIRYGPPGPLAAFAPDGLTMASDGRDETIRLWSRRRDLWGRPAWGVMQTRRWATARLTPRKAPARYGFRSTTALAFAPDGQSLASVSGWGITIRLWRHRRGRWGKPAWGIMPRRRRPHARFRSLAHRVIALAFAPDGQTLASASEHGDVSLWDINSGTNCYHSNIGIRITALAWHPAGIALSTASGVILLDFVDGRHDARAERRIAQQRGS
jgi:WD40 repeat protein